MFRFVDLVCFRLCLVLFYLVGFSCFAFACWRFVVRFGCGNLVLFGGVWVLVGGQCLGLVCF